MQLKHLIIFVFLVLNIQKHIRKYKHTYICFLYILPTHSTITLFTNHQNLK